MAAIPLGILDAISPGASAATGDNGGNPPLSFAQATTIANKQLSQQEASDADAYNKWDWAKQGNPPKQLEDAWNKRAAVARQLFAGQSPGQVQQDQAAVSQPQDTSPLAGATQALQQANF